METTGKAAVIGSNDSVLAFKALGLEVFIADDIILINDMIRRLSNNGYIIFFVTEKLAQDINNSRYRARPYPIIIPIPDGQVSTGYGAQILKNNIKKALGTEIIFKD